jgi:pimeloyl-ACP methyl ester carboxylesterase
MAASGRGRPANSRQLTRVARGCRIAAAGSVAGVRRAVAVLAVAGSLLTACTGGSAGHPQAGPTPSSGTPAPSTTSVPPVPGVPAAFTDPYGCLTGFVCAGLPVPVDRDHPTAGQLTLQVALEADPAAPRGVLVLLNGGPGAAMAPLATTFADRLGPDVVAAYRVVAVDTRGTGTTAIDCPDLQAEQAHQFVPTADAVRACADFLGAVRGDYGTDATVADLDRLRRALGAPRLTLVSLSYGTFVAQQYALAHPTRVRSLVLDSATPIAGPDPVGLDTVRAVPGVLRDACRSQHCPGDPVADLADAVRHGDGADLLSLVVAMSAARPSYDSLLTALHAAARGRPFQLDQLLTAYKTGLGASADVFSAGLDATATCGDLRFPWGRSDAPLAGRAAAVRREVARAGSLYPFDAASVRGGAAVATCQPWPRVRPSRLDLTASRLPGVPALFLAGDRDLTTPVDSVRAEVRASPDARLVVIRGAGHVTTAMSAKARAEVRRFLLR